MKFASINLRINLVSDKEYAWSYRKQRVIELIRRESFDIIGCQEASFDMVNDLNEGLSDIYHIYYQQRDQNGEGTPILYKKNLNIQEMKTFWLSDTPEVESVIRGSHFPRIMSYIRLNHLLFINTHLDYASDDVCLKQAKYLHHLIERLKNSDDRIIITGDFNVYPTSKTMKYMKSLYLSLDRTEDEEQLTFHGFSNQRKGKPIDYILYSNNLVMSDYRIHHNQDKDYLSDHYPISAVTHDI